MGCNALTTPQCCQDITTHLLDKPPKNLCQNHLSMVSCLSQMLTLKKWCLRRALNTIVILAVPHAPSYGATSLWKAKIYNSTLKHALDL